MNGFTTFLSQQLLVLQIILIIASVIAGFFVLKNTKKLGLIEIQGKTIEAQQQQIEALREQNEDQQKKIDRLEFDSKLMLEALEDEGIFVTIDGKKVTIKNINEPGTSHHITRRTTKQPKVPLQGKKEEV